MTFDTREKLSSNTVLLHWIVGLTVIAMLAVGVYMEETETFALYPWHKSFGVLIFFFVLLRVMWRIKNGWPTPVREYERIEQQLSKVVHYVLLIGTVAMPLSGFLMSAFGGNGVDFFGIELVARNPDPANPQEVIAHNGAFAGFDSFASHVGCLCNDRGACLTHCRGAQASRDRQGWHPPPHAWRESLTPCACYAVPTNRSPIWRLNGVIGTSPVVAGSYRSRTAFRRNAMDPFGARRAKRTAS